MKNIHPVTVMPFLMACLAMLLFSGCKSQERKGNATTSAQAESVKNPGLHFIKTGLYPEGAWEALSADQRRYSLDSFDLDQSGSLHYLLAIPTMNCCGSGGCRFWILTPSGSLVSTTSVADYPIGISRNSSNGWYDLLTWSNRKHRVLTWNGKAYTSNASVAGGISEEERKALTQDEVLLNPFQDFVGF